MSRRNAFDRLHKAGPQEPIATIPLAKDHKRDNRAWDRKHRGSSYFIPSHLHLQAKDIRSAILALSQKHMTTTSSVANAFMGYALAHIRSGKLVIEPRPNAQRRKMALTWEEADEWPQEIPSAIKQKRSLNAEELYLNYRWGRDVDAQIKALAGTSIATGEVVVFLLNYALDAHKQGRLRLKEEAVVVAQKVSPTW